MKRYFFLNVCASFLIIFSSCTKDEPQVIINEISVGGVSFDIASAGYFYNSDYDGFDFVFTEVKTDLSRAVDYIPSGSSFVLDIPGECSEGEFDLTEHLTNHHWAFYINYWCDGKLVLKKYDSSYFLSGKMSISMSDSKLVLSMTASTVDNFTIEVNYSGNPVKSEEYIYSWEYANVNTPI